ncbi:hypothetical protein E6C27_scaffold21G00090 [Cucumis melo var. makuwa]|uniref:DUF4218 domain-containing protein n=1 Tax=Cucumis melo var. makuwa TaxID=1194695 RepID=A0A5A7VG24_CUCMM|nr:hypothetical protein E6C27_scaffold21G00090 [Cucumis melo var. makuwa]
MKVLKNYVRNRHHPEGCIAESYIVEEAIEFCSDFLSGVDLVGLDIDRLDASLDNSRFGRPLSAGVSFNSEQDLLYQAHRYVLANTIDVQPYIDKHVEVLQLKYLNKVLHQKWIQEEHNRTFISWLREEVVYEIGMGNVEISDNLRWIAHGPHPFVIKYNSYVINGCRYHTESYDKNRSVQNSGCLDAIGLRTIMIQVMLDGQLCLLHHREIEKINQMTMNLEISCYIVKEYLVICQMSMEVTIWMRICQHMYDQTVKAHGFLNNTLIFSLHMEPTIVRDDQDKEVGGAEIDGLVVGVVDEHVEKPKQQRKQGPTIMFDVTRVRSEGERKLVEYNEDGVPIGENGAKLNSFIGSCVHYYIPIIYATWIDVPAELKEKIYTIVESILKTAGTTFRQFKHWLTKKYILPFKNEPELLKRPPYMYSYIDQKQWEEFVRSRLCPHFEDKRKLQQERRKKNKYNHRLSRKGYANLREELKNIPSKESELDRASMWKKTRVDKKGQYDNEDIQEVVNRIDEISKTCADKEPSPNDVLTQALAKRSKKRNEEIDKLSEENEKLRLRVQELENIHISTQSTPTSAHGSCSRPRLEYDIQCKKNVENEVVKEEVNVDVIILNDLQEDAIEVRNEKEVVCESNMKMPLPLKIILRFAEKSSAPVERTYQSRDPEGYTYQSSDPEGCIYQSSALEGCTYQSSAPEGCTYQSSTPEGCTYQSSAPEGCTYP